jgi:addiction module RelE/StbE family toxin
MRTQFDTDFYKLYKKANIRIQKAVDQKIALFEKDPFDPQLNNHELHEEYEGLRSIDVTNDYRALYEEVPSGDETIAYFSLLGTHEELYG